MSKGKFARLFAAAFVAAGLTVIPAWSALAVTNPADNPSPITVIGDDGNTYNDGADTLPGYDDEECTYIPGAWFDFANNKVHYADGQWIHWTEWSRASGYSEWLAKQNSNSNTNTSGNTDNSSTTTDKTATTGAVKKGATKTSANGEVTTDVAEATTLSGGVDVAAQTTGITVAVGESITNNPGRTVGLTILASLFGAGALLLAGSALRTRLQQGGTN